MFHVLRKNEIVILQNFDVLFIYFKTSLQILAGISQQFEADFFYFEWSNWPTTEHTMVTRTNTIS